MLYWIAHYTYTVLYNVVIFELFSKLIFLSFVTCQEYGEQRDEAGGQVRKHLILIGQIPIIIIIIIIITH